MTESLASPNSSAQPDDVDVGGQTGFGHPACNSSGNDSGTIAVADIILYDEHRPDAPLLAANNGTEVRIINIASFYVHDFFHLLAFSVVPYRAF